MKLNEVELIFSKDKTGHYLFQLRTGKMIFYSLIGYYQIYIFDDKTYKVLYKINMLEFINKYEKENNDDKSLIKNELKIKMNITIIIIKIVLKN